MPQRSSKLKSPSDDTRAHQLFHADTQACLSVVRYHHASLLAYTVWLMLIRYFINLAALKLSLLLFYLRIFPSQTIRTLLWCTVVFDILFGVGFTVAGLLECMPLDFFWHMWDGEHQGHCININALGWANAIISIAMDLWMLALPLSQLGGLRLHWKKKVGVALMFCVGTL